MTLNVATTSIIGQIVTRFDVEQATIRILNKWLETYLLEIERQQGLNLGVIPRPPAPPITPFDNNLNVSTVSQSIHGGVDALMFTVGNTPEVVVMVKPAVAPLNTGAGNYQQAFTVSVVAIIEDQDADRSRWIADFYGAAIEGCMVQTLELEGFADRVAMTAFPETNWIDTDAPANLVQNQSEYTVYVTVINEWNGLPNPETAPPGSGPVATETDLVLSATGLSDALGTIFDGGADDSTLTAFLDGGTPETYAATIDGGAATTLKTSFIQGLDGSLSQITFDAGLDGGFVNTTNDA